MIGREEHVYSKDWKPLDCKYGFDGTCEDARRIAAEAGEEIKMRRTIIHVDDRNGHVNIKTKIWNVMPDQTMTLISEETF